ncbi:MAG TPA: ArsA-related P-loop ATPase [Sandaracinaceae bacterium LLY-WYZ-13_1]|nr:ArsA-related P-loop ATPase [Sandaracinaceae bacterium LLY-WYZ-13_1]
MVESDAAARGFPPLSPIVLVTGKGGVGKTTLAAGLAEAAARRDGKATLVEFGDAESGRRVLGSRSKVKHEVVEPKEALEKSVGRLLGSKMLAKIFIGNFAVRRMLRAAPALRELAMLDAVGQIADRAQGKRVVVDMPATGHGLAWLRLPMQMRDLFGSGGLYELSERLVHRLVAPRACSVVVVTLPERMVLQETLELCAALEREVGMPPARLVVNRFPTPLPGGALAQARAMSEGGEALSDEAGHLVEVLEAREAARSEALSTLGSAGSLGVDLRPLLLPLVTADPDATQVAEWLLREQAA